MNRIVTDPTREWWIRRVLALSALLLLLGSVPGLAQDGCTNVGCNSSTVTSVLFPDTPATVYVNLRTVCGSQILKSCQVNFLSPPTLNPQEKCAELVLALRSGSCLAAGYEVSVDQCAASPPMLVVTDPEHPQSLIEVGITCDPNVFSQTGQGQPICDYEGDIITPGDQTTGLQCMSDGAQATEVTVRGTATGNQIVTSMPSTPRFSILVMREGQNVPVAVEVFTAPGMSDQQIVAQAAEQLLAMGLPVQVLNDGRTVRLNQELPGNPVAFGAATNDTGITHAIIGGQADQLPAEFPPPFASLGECISTWIAERCAGLTGQARAACNQAQQAECRLLFE